MTKQKLINLKDGTLIYIHIKGFAPRLRIFNRKDLFVNQGEQGYLDVSMFARPRNIRLATRQDIEEHYQKRLKTINEWKEDMLKSIKED